MRKCLLFFIPLLVLLAGCGKAPQAAPASPPAPAFTLPETAPTSQPDTDAAPTDPKDSAAVYDGCATNGDVMEFSSDGCTISVALTENLQGGVSIMSGASPGHEDEFPTAVIRYSPDCVFTRVYVSLSTGKVQCEPASREDVKKQTYLVVHGDTGSDGTITAKVVYLYRVVA